MCFSDVSKTDWQTVSLVTQVVRLMQVLLLKVPTSLSPEHWDFLLCSMLGWIQV